MTDMKTLDEKESSFLRKLLVIVIPILVVLGFTVLTFVLIELNKKPEEKKKSFNILAVMSDYAYREGVSLSVHTQGEVRPRSEIDLVPQVAGKIVYVSPNFIEGGIFKKDEVLVRIEEADYRVALVQAEANMAQMEQNLVREISESEIARRDYAELGAGTPSALALREPQKRQAEAALQAAKAQYDSMQLQLSRTEVRAPFDGRVRSRMSDIGQYVTPGRALGRIFSTDIMIVRLPLSNRDLAKLDIPIAYVAQDRESAFDVILSTNVAGKKQTWQGKLMRTDSRFDTLTRTLFAIVEVFDPFHEGVSDAGIPIVPGLFVDAYIKGRSYDNAIILPRDGLRPDNEVYVINKDGKVDIRRVEVLETNSHKAILASGVEAGELVVLSPLERSRTVLPLQALNVHDPSQVLVDPPPPEDDESDDQESNGKKKKRKES